MKTLAFAAALAAFGQTATAHEYKIADLVIDHPMAFETAVSAMSGGGYLTITNNGATDDTLIGVETPFPRAELHLSEEKDGVAVMTHQENGIAIPAGETVKLAPGGYHVMFMGLNGDPFEVGEEIPVTLIFEKAGSLDVIFNVESRNGTAQVDHSAHSN